MIVVVSAGPIGAGSWLVASGEGQSLLCVPVAAVMVSR